MFKNCTATFRWETRAACAITTTKNNVSSAQVDKSRHSTASKDPP